MKNLKNFFLDLLFPIQCLGCNKEGEWLCRNCFESIKINSVFSSYCLKKVSPDLVKVLIAADYKQPLLQKILRSYKYNFIQGLSESLSSLLIKFIDQIKAERNLNFDIVIPVPLAKKRIIWRGFNQSESLATNISQKFNWTLNSKLLIRRYHVAPQVGSSAKKRKHNIKGIFKVTDSQILKDKKILLIDDVVTTGATLSECAKVLMQSGAAEVWGLVIAKG